MPMCACGCGQVVTRQWVRGHNGRKTPFDWVEADRGFETPCWIWQRAIDAYGYGSKKVGSRSDGTRKQVKAHRWYYERHRGTIPANRLIHHCCYQRDCVNPEHMEIVTETGSLRRNSDCVMTEAWAAIIREEEGSTRLIADRHGVDYELVRRIRKREVWMPEETEVS